MRYFYFRISIAVISQIQSHHATFHNHTYIEAIRLDTERRAADLEAENEKQKLKMQNAIEGLAKQLPGS